MAALMEMEPIVFRKLELLLLSWILDASESLIFPFLCRLLHLSVFKKLSTSPFPQTKLEQLQQLPVWEELHGVSCVEFTF